MSAACCVPPRSRRRAPSASAARSPPKSSRRSKTARSRRSSASRRRSGLQSVTDGEFRRAFWNYDFLGELDGVEAYLGERKIKFQGPQPKPMMLRVIGKLGGYRAHPMIEHFKFVAAHAKRDAENDDSLAVVAAFPLRPRRSAGRDLSRHGRFLSRSRRGLPQGGARLQRRRLPLSPARRGQFHLSLRSQAARASSPTAARIRKRFRTSMPA